MNVVNENSKNETPDIEFKNEMRLRKYGGEFFQLERNGFALRCPIIPPLLTQKITEASNLAIGQQAQTKIEQIESPKSCNSTCALFHMRASAGGYRVTCSNGHLEHEVKEIVASPIKKG